MSLPDPLRTPLRMPVRAPLCGPIREPTHASGQFRENAAMLGSFMRLFARERGWMLAGLGTALSTLLAGLALFGLSGGFLATAAIAGLTPASALAFNFFAPAAGVRFLAIARPASRWGERVVTHEATFRLLARLRSWLYRGIAVLSPRQLARYHGADLLNRLTRDIDALDNLYLRFGVPYAAAWLTMIIVLGVLAWWDARLLAPVVALMLLALVMLPWMGWRLGNDSARRVVSRREALRRDLLDCAETAEDLALHAAAWEHQRGATLASHQALLDAQFIQQRRAAWLRSLLALAAGLVAWSVLGIAATHSIETGMPAPWLAVLPLLLLGTAEALQGLPAACLELPGTAAAAGRLRALVGQAPHPDWVERGASAANGTLELVGLTHAHDPAVPLLRDLDLSIPAGRHIALLGASGSGKSTLISLIARLEDPDAGHIRLGGVPLTAFDEPALRASIACLTQDAWLFTGTLADNLRIARSAATDDELLAVMDCVGLTETIARWPEGLATEVSEGGASLSGGQRRRLALARVLLRDAAVTLLDEPAEGLDAPAEAQLVAAVRKRLAGRTLVWVTHRADTADAFDHALVLEDGTLRPSGGA